MHVEKQKNEGHPESNDSDPPEPDPDFIVHVDSGVEGVNTSWLQHYGLKAIHVIRPTLTVNSSVAVRVLDDQSMRELHQQHSGINETTDVLTFNQSDGIIDIAICKDFALRESERRPHDLNSELLLYIVHGLLHCFGHDDKTDRDYELMHLEEDKILAAIGVGAIWGGNK